MTLLLILNIDRGATIVIRALRIPCRTLYRPCLLLFEIPAPFACRRLSKNLALRDKNHRLGALSWLSLSS